MQLYENTEWNELTYSNGEVVKVPKDWNFKKIKETKNVFIDGDRGVKYPSHKDLFKSGYCVFLDAKNITKNGFSLEDNKFITKDKDNELRKGKLSLNDIVITTRGTLGNIGIYDEKIHSKIPHARINSGMVIFRVSENYCSKFMSLYLISDNWKKQNINGGGVIPQLTITKMKENYIPSIKKEEQESIASLLIQQQSIISKTKDLIENLDIRNKFIMDELLSGRLRVKEENKEFIFYKNQEDNWQSIKMNGEDINIPRDWDKLSLGSIHMPFVKSGVKKYDGVLDYYATGEVDDFSIGIKPTGSFTYDKKPSRANVKVLNNTIYLARMKNTLKILKFEKAENFLLSTGFLGVQPNAEKVSLDYLYYKIISDSFQKIKNKECKGATQETLSDGAAEKIEILIPSIEEQKSIANSLKCMFDELEKYKQVLEKEEKTFTFLLEELMSGRLRIKI